MIYFFLMKDLPLLEILRIITTSCNFTQMYGFIKILEYPTKMNRLRKETCTLPEHNIPSRERERERKTFLEQAAFWHEVKVV